MDNEIKQAEQYADKRPRKGSPEAALAALEAERTAIKVESKREGGKFDAARFAAVKARIVELKGELGIG